MGGGKGMYPEVKLSHLSHLPYAGWYAPCEANKRKSVYNEVDEFTRYTEFKARVFRATNMALLTKLDHQSNGC